MTSEEHNELREKTTVLLEQYKLYIEMMDRTSQRRMDSGKYYLTVLTGISAIVPLIFGEKKLLIEEFGPVLLVVSILGLLICCTWISNIASYRNINSAKFEVILDMEKKLSYPCYEREWNLLQKDSNKRYIQFSKVERIIPIIFIIPSLVLFIYSITLLF
jgi:hypothetical protein